MPNNNTRVILENPRRWKLAKDITNMGFYDWYPQEDRIIWDEVLHKITGLSTKSKLRRQEYFISVVHPEDVERVVSDMEKVLDPRNPENTFNNNLRILLNGKTRHMRTSGFREIDTSGQVYRVFGIVMDTTSKIEAEIRIRENEERLRIASKATGFGTFDLLVPENSLFWDKRMHEIFGLSEKSKVDRNDYFFKCIHPDDKARVAENYGRRMSSLSEETSAFDEFRIVVKGEVKYLTSHGRIVRDSKRNVIRVTGTIFDISNLKKTEQELRESQEYFRSIFEGNSDYIFTINKERKIVFINSVSPGLSMEDVVGTSIIDLAIPKDRKMIKKTLNIVFSKGTSEQYETTFEGPNGVIYYSTRVSPLIDNGDVFGATFIARDITELKESELKLREQAIELQRTNQNLEQFAYVSSHDIKAPVTNLESLVKIMEEDGAVTEGGKPIFSRVKSTVHQMKKTIQSLNEVFSIQSNLNLPRRKLGLESNLKEVLESINNQIEDSKAKVSYDFTKAPNCNFPKTHLKSILQNLATNSIKYHRPGITPKIKIKSKPDKKSDRIVIEFSDNGRGFDLDSYGYKVFGLFQRFHLDTEGKGMGLHIIKMIIESYGGKIILNSKINKGARFTLVI